MPVLRLSDDQRKLWRPYSSLHYLILYTLYFSNAKGCNCSTQIHPLIVSIYVHSWLLDGWHGWYFQCKYIYISICTSTNMYISKWIFFPSFGNFSVILCTLTKMTHLQTAALLQVRNTICCYLEKKSSLISKRKNTDIWIKIHTRRSKHWADNTQMCLKTL